LSIDLKDFISNCEQCKATKKLKIINTPEKPIIDSGPHDEYQIDL
jgi:hypothetical protein